MQAVESRNSMAATVAPSLRRETCVRTPRGDLMAIRMNVSPRWNEPEADPSAEDPHTGASATRQPGPQARHVRREKLARPRSASYSSQEPPASTRVQTDSS